MELLLNQGVHIDIKDNAGRTALHYAAGASRGSAYPYAETSAMASAL
jgi:ankyrin repeat protein